MNRRVLLLALLLFAEATVAARRVDGRVRGADGKPVAGAAVTLVASSRVSLRAKPTSKLPPGALATTDPRGTFSFEVPPTGDAPWELFIDAGTRRVRVPLAWDPLPPVMTIRIRLRGEEAAPEVVLSPTPAGRSEVLLSFLDRMQCLQARAASAVDDAERRSVFAETMALRADVLAHLGASKATTRRALSTAMCALLLEELPWPEDGKAQAAALALKAAPPESPAWGYALVGSSIIGGAFFDTDVAAREHLLAVARTNRSRTVRVGAWRQLLRVPLDRDRSFQTIVITHSDDVITRSSAS